MPIYFRKSFGKGPLRINLSRRGVGASFGVRGLRVGIGPRGTYVRAGRGGFTYQTSLKASPARSALAAKVVAQPGELTPSDDDGSADVGDDEVVENWQRQRSAARYSGWVCAAALLIGMFAGGNSFLWVVALILFGFGLWRVKSERHSRNIEINYDLDAHTLAKYSSLCDAFREVAGCDRMWRIITSQEHDRKRNAGTSIEVTRTVCSVIFDGVNDLRTNVQYPSLPVGVTQMAFLPDRILLVSKNAISSIAYKDTKFRSDLERFVEDAEPPSDGTQVGTTWQFVNRSGDPDRRFKDNRQLAVMMYSDLCVESQVFQVRYQLSRRGSADAVVAALNAMSADRNAGETTTTKRTFVNLLSERIRAAVPPLDEALRQVKSPRSGPVLSQELSLKAIKAQGDATRALGDSAVKICSADLASCLSSGQTSEADRWLSQIRSLYAQLIDWKRVVLSLHPQPIFNHAVELLALTANDISVSLVAVGDQLREVSGDVTKRIHTSLNFPHVTEVASELERIESLRNGES